MRAPVCLEVCRHVLKEGPIMCDCPTMDSGHMDSYPRVWAWCRRVQGGPPTRPGTNMLG